MENKALYRKYRPSAFDGLVGQDHIKVTLENAIKNGTTSHAYVFTGPRGTGKTSTARLFAKALNCEQPIGINPCGQCTACQNDTDIIESDAASNNGVDDIRALRENISLAPMYGKYKIYILDEAHMLTSQAFNAFLKTLEEPPAHARFILATTEVHKLPATIISRCQRFDFRRIRNEDIVARLEYILTAENRTAHKEALELIAQVAAGGMRDSISLLDQALSRKASVTEAVTLDDVLALTGAVDVRLIGRLLHLIANNQLEDALAHFNKCFEDGKEPKFFVEELMIYLRDVLVSKKLGDRATLKKGATDVNFKSVADSLDTTKIFFYLEVLQKTLNDISFHHDLQLLLEMSIVRMVQGDKASLQAQIDELRAIIQSGNLVSQSVTEDVKTPVIEQVSQPVFNHTPELIELSPNDEIVSANDLLSIDPIPMPQNWDSNESSGDSLSMEVVVTNSEHDVVVLEDPIQFLEAAKEMHEKGIDWMQSLPSETVELKSVSTPVEPQFVTPAVEESFSVPTFEMPGNAPAEPQFVTPAVEEPFSVPTFEMPGNAPAEPQFVVPAVEEPFSVPTFEMPDNASAEPQFVTPAVEEPLNVPALGNVILSDVEEEALQILRTSVKTELDALKHCLSNIQFELGNLNLSSKRIFSEFDVKAVNNSHFIITHENRVNVALINKLAHKKNISEAFENVYKPLKYVALTNEQWLTISNLI